VFQYLYQPNDGTKLGFKVLAEGPAQFMISKVTENDENGYPLKDNNGHPKFLVELKAKDTQGSVGLIEEQFSGSAKASWKIGELLESIGLGQDYNQSGQLDLQKLVGKRGRAIIYINKYEKRNGTTGQNMKVREFVNPNPQPAQQAAPAPVYQAPPSPPVQAYAQQNQSNDFDDQDIPF
jgi:hypothetical protein